MLCWINSERVYVRRAAAVCLIRSGKGFTVTYDIKKILFVVESLKDDIHPHIQKACGWLLKYAYLTYPEEIVDFLQIVGDTY